MSDLFQEKAQEWDTNPLVTQLSNAVSQSILDRVNLSADMHVMDLGAGTGLLCSHIAPHIKQITAVDISPAMLEKLKAKDELAGKIDIVCADITQESTGATYDLIISAMAMHHIEDTTQLIKQLATHLKSGAQIALADLDKEDGSFHPPETEGVFHYGFERSALENLLRDNGFTEIAFTTAHTVNKESGDYSIFLVTAKRV